LFKLRDYQKDIVNQVINTEMSILVQLPTGGGKTKIAREIIKLAIKEDLQVLFVVPRDILMDQAITDFEEIGLKPYKLHGDNLQYHNEKVIVSILNTVYKKTDLFPDIIIIDEIHYGYEGIMIEQLKSNTKSRLIGLSATPYDKYGKKLRGFDRVIDKYDLKYMIENKFLVDIECHVLTHINNFEKDLKKIKINDGDYDINELSSVVCNDKLILNIVRDSIPFIEKSKKAIVFAVDINHAEALNKVYKMESIKSGVVHSNMEKESSTGEIDKFKNDEIKVLISVSMLTIGFDVPETDLAILARPTKSQNLYKQMVGRVLRKPDGKTHAVLLDAGNVIKNLGNPLDPIKERAIAEYLNKKECEICGNLKIKRIKIGGNLYWKCDKCKYLKPIERKDFKCSHCQNSYSSENAKLKIFNDSLWLHCNKCNTHTHISKYREDLEFEKIKDAKYDKTDEKSEIIRNIILCCEKEDMHLLKQEYKKLSFHDKYIPLIGIIELSSEKFLLKFINYLNSDEEFIDELSIVLEKLIEDNNSKLFSKIISKLDNYDLNNINLSCLNETINDDIFRTIYNRIENSSMYHFLIKIVELNKLNLAKELIRNKKIKLEELVWFNFHSFEKLINFLPHMWEYYDITQLFRREICFDMFSSIKFLSNDKLLKMAMHSKKMGYSAEVLPFLELLEIHKIKIIVDKELVLKRIEEIIAYDNLPFFKLVMKSYYNDKKENFDESLIQKIEKYKPTDIITYLNNS